jgi:protoporphyrinogen/coproporphyrinogen III oxidase
MTSPSDIEGEGEGERKVGVGGEGRSTAAVVGAGLAGLAAAWTLREEGWRVVVLEAGPEVGGVVRSESVATPFGALVVERGPQTLSTRDPELLELFAAVRLADRILDADASGGVRYVVRGGRPVRVPHGPGSLLATPLLSPGGKLRLLSEPLRGRRGGGGGGADPMDESVASFVRRRFGTELLDRLVDPFVSGVFAGDPETLALGAVFPDLVRAEQEHGSVLLGMLRARDRAPQRGSRPRGRIVSFEGGLQAWPRRVAEAIEGGTGPGAPGRIHLGAPVVELAARGPRWSVRWEGPEPGRAEVDAVVLATPAEATARLLHPVDPAASEALSGIRYAPVTVVHAAWPRDRVRHPIDGFGLLVPSMEGRRILGSLWPGTLFPGRVPPGLVLTANFVGGARTPELAALPDAELEGLVQEELSSLIGAEGPPAFTLVTRWPGAIPQYRAGHGRRVSAVAAAESRHPGLALAGSWRGGVSLGATWQGGVAAARTLGPPALVAGQGGA